MKRSEALRYLGNVFYEQNLEPDEADELADEVLSYLEENVGLKEWDKEDEK